MSEPVAYKIVPLNMVTTSENERDKWIKAGHEVEALYPASAYEALNKQLEIQVKAEYQLILDVVYLKKQNEALKAENEAQAKRIAELEQKEIVLDRLITKFEGKHKFVGTKMVYKESPRVSQIGLNETSVCVERADVFEWVFRADGEPSFKQAVMNLLTASKNGDSNEEFHTD